MRHHQAAVLFGLGLMSAVADFDDEFRLHVSPIPKISPEARLSTINNAREKQEAKRRRQIERFNKGKK